MTKPNKFKKWIWVAIIGTALAIWIPVSKVKEMLKSKDTVDSISVITVTQDHIIIDSLNRVIDTYKQDRQDLSNTIDKLNQQVSDLKTSASNRESTIKQLKQGTNEKVSNVNTFTNSDIYKLLSDRYKDSTSVK